MLNNIIKQFYHSKFSTLEGVGLLYEAGLRVPEKFDHVQLDNSLTSSETLSHYMDITLESCEQSPSSEQCVIDEASLSELLEIWNYVISAEGRMCDETYKDDYPERAKAAHG